MFSKHHPKSPCVPVLLESTTSRVENIWVVKYCPRNVMSALVPLKVPILWGKFLWWKRNYSFVCYCSSPGTASCRCAGSTTPRCGRCSMRSSRCCGRTCTHLSRRSPSSTARRTKSQRQRSLTWTWTTWRASPWTRRHTHRERRA